MLEAGVAAASSGPARDTSPHGQPAPPQAELVAALDRQGSVSALAAHYDVSVSTAYRWLRAREVAMPQASTATRDHDGSRAEGEE